MSTTKQPTLADFGSETLEDDAEDVDHEPEEPDQPTRESLQARQWTPKHRECLGCGAKIDDPREYRGEYTDEHQNVIACPNCVSGLGGKEFNNVWGATERYMDKLASGGVR